jgi:hypothetical protein
MLLLLLGAWLTPIELGDKMVAPLAALRDPEETDEGRGDEKKLRADSPAISDYACTYIKKLSKGLGRKTDGGFMGNKDLGTADQKLNRWDSFPKFLDFLMNRCEYFLSVATVDKSFYLRDNQPQHCLFGDLEGGVGVQLSFKILRGYLSSRISTGPVS